MKDMVVIGDINTVSVFRMAGVTAIVADRKKAREALFSLSARHDVAVIIITRELAEDMPDELKRINLNPAAPVIVEVPGIDDTAGFGKSAMDYITEALGIAM